MDARQRRSGAAEFLNQFQCPKEGTSIGDGAEMGPDRRVKQRSKTHFCIPDDIPGSQMVSVLQNSVRLLVTEYPEDLKLPAVSIVDSAMNLAFPCPKSN
jgi:Rap1a immunity proteins